MILLLSLVLILSLILVLSLMLAVLSLITDIACRRLGLIWRVCDTPLGVGLAKKRSMPVDRNEWYGITCGHVQAGVFMNGLTDGKEIQVGIPSVFFNQLFKYRVNDAMEIPKIFFLGYLFCFAVR